MTPEQAHNTLKNLVYSAWQKSACEAHMDDVKILGAVDFFLPYFPLGADSLQSLFEKNLGKEADRLRKVVPPIKLSWDKDVVEFLLSKVTHLNTVMITTKAVSLVPCVGVPHSRQ